MAVGNIIAFTLDAATQMKRTNIGLFLDPYSTQNF